jgi:hypothetical protein
VVEEDEVTGVPRENTRRRGERYRVRPPDRPGLASDPEPLRLICHVGALLPFGSFLGFFVLGLSDRRLMLDTLSEAGENE